MTKINNKADLVSIGSKFHLIYVFDYEALIEIGFLLKEVKTEHFVSVGRRKDTYIFILSHSREDTDYLYKIKELSLHPDSYAIYSARDKNI